MKKEEKNRTNGIIQSLDKGLYLLEVVEEARAPISLQQLWEKLGWDKATIFRLLTTLERRGYISRNSKTKTYTLGLKIYGLYDSLISELDIQQIAHPYLEKLEENTGQTAHLGVIIEKSVVFIDKVVGTEILSVNTQIGSREPLHCTALGKAFLAYIEENEAASYIDNPLEQFTTNTLTNVDDLMLDLRQVKRKGYALDDEEYAVGVRCVASPVLNQYNHPVAVLGISGPKSRITSKEIDQYGHLIKQYAFEISQRMGYRHEEVNQF